MADQQDREWDGCRVGCLTCGECCGVVVIKKTMTLAWGQIHITAIQDFMSYETLPHTSGNAISPFFPSLHIYLGVYTLCGRGLCLGHHVPTCAHTPSHTYALSYTHCIHVYIHTHMLMAPRHRLYSWSSIWFISVAPAPGIMPGT